jgi:hypothetical protein
VTRPRPDGRGHQGGSGPSERGWRKGTGGGRGGTLIGRDSGIFLDDLNLAGARGNADGGVKSVDWVEGGEGDEVDCERAARSWK